MLFFQHEASCSDGQIRLIDGYTERYGRVEICSDQRWETLNYYQWTYDNARVACFELGFTRCEFYIILHLNFKEILVGVMVYDFEYIM